MTAGLASPVFAAPTITPSQLKGPAAGTNNITLTGITFPTPSVVEFQTEATCTANYSAPSGTAKVVATTVSGQGSTSLVVTVPTLAAGAYNICVYPGTNTLSSAKAGETITGTRYTAVAAGTGTLDAARGPVGGGNVLTLSDTSTAFGAGSAVEFTTTACATTYATPATGTIVASPTVVASGGSSLTAVAPTGLTQPNYYVCAYTGNTASTSALISGTASTDYSPGLPLSTINPGTGPAAGTNTVTVNKGTAFPSPSYVSFQTGAGCSATFAATSSTAIVNSPTVTGGGTTSLVVTVPTLAAGAYNICVYSGNTPTSSPLVAESTGTPTRYQAAATGTASLSQARGPLVGGNTVTLSDNNAAFTTGTAVEFNAAGTCPAVYTTPASGIVPATVGAISPGATSTTLTVTVPVAGLNQASYSVCAYTGNSAGTSALVSGANAGYAVGQVFTSAVTPNKGPATGGNRITLTDTNGAFNLNPVSVQFNSAACPVTFAASGAVTAGAPTGGDVTATTLRVTVPPLAAGAYYVCVYKGNVASVSALNSETATASYTSRDTNVVTFGTSNGPTGGGNSVTLTSTGTFPSGATVELPTGALCPDTDAAADPVATGTRIIAPGNRMVITMPVTSAGAHKVCVFNGGNLIGESLTDYTTAAGVTVNSVSPAAGPAQGNTLITVSGANFTQNMTASLGGVPLTIVQVNGTTSFTAYTPAHAPTLTPLSLTVTTASGPYTKANAFSYSNGIVVTPNRAVNTASIDISVEGVGFLDLDFTSSTHTAGTTPNSAGAHVYLVQGEYDSKEYVTNFKANDALLECVDVLVIDDKQLVCTLFLAGNDVGGTRRLAWGSDVSINGTGDTVNAAIKVGSNMVTTATAAFARKDVGRTVVAAEFPAGTTVVSVLDTKTIVLSARATASNTDADLDLVKPRTDTITAATVGQTTITDASAVAGDEGKSISGTNIQPGTVITDVTGTTITLSKPVLGTTGTSAIIGEPPVPIGTYTVTVVSDGQVDAITDIAGYTQSIVTSGSTFTVGPY